MVMEDGLWSNCPELRRKRVPGIGRSNHERTVSSQLRMHSAPETDCRPSFARNRLGSSQSLTEPSQTPYAGSTHETREEKR